MAPPRLPGHEQLTPAAARLEPAALEPALRGPATLEPATPDERAVLLDPDLKAARAARRFLRSTLPGISEDGLHTALLLVSELVSNAVKHGTGPVRLSVSSLPDGSPVRVRIGVVDDDPRPPRLPHLDSDGPEGGSTGAAGRGLNPGSFLTESGRGVLLLDALATRWGVASEPPGKQVWFELDIRG